MTSPVSAIEAIEKAMEGVTPGPWYPGHLGTDSTCQCRSIVDEGIYMGAIATVHVDNGLPIGEGGNDAPPAEEAAANMRYIAACSPDRMREVLALARQAEALQRENAEKDAEIVRLRRLATDRSYMMKAYREMLGPTGLEVALMWDRRGVTRQHTDWGPKAYGLSGEERARVLLDADKQIGRPIDSIDPPDFSARALLGGENAGN